ncbi:hypothetical protein ACE193_21510 [Bernardetia sp. OM2101]|uniref:hypothetical protein n=1 Tax=Bernardetia sp. OM2101 TaxID=3344876 RepID=UPI0035CF929B
MLGNSLYQELIKFANLELIMQEDEVFYLGDYYINFQENEFVIIQENEFGAGNKAMKIPSIHLDTIEDFSFFFYCLTGKYLLSVLINDKLKELDSYNLLESNLFNLGVKYISQEFFQPTLNTRRRTLKYEPQLLFDLCWREIRKDLELKRENRAIYQSRFEQVNKVWKKVNTDLVSQFDKGIGDDSFSNHFIRHRDIF